jgi:aryl sulfotransferase
MPELIRAPQRAVRSRVFDSSRWDGYRPRDDDIVIATYSKCGTTWMQRIVSMLVLKSAEPTSIWELSPWPDMRMFGPVEDVLARAEALTCRRFFKSHLPYDALPIYRGVKFIHVARDGRDAALSLHNHLANFTPAAVEMANAVSLSDPKFGDSYPQVPADPAEFFALWLEDGGAQGDEGSSFFTVERGFWAARREPDVLLVHYNDLKLDLAGEMRRIAGFLDIELREDLWPTLVEAAGFEAMKRDGGKLLPMAEGLWEGGADRFLHKGSVGRWRELFDPADLQRYEELVARECSPALASWLEKGRLGATDPAMAAD